MAIIIKSESEIQLMRESGKILAEVLAQVEELIQPGISTYEIDRKCAEFIEAHGCTPSFLNYNGFPASICTSINDEVVHGIPNKDKILGYGDIISLDCGVIHKGFHSDAARTLPVGEISDQAQELIDVTKQSFFEGIRFAKEGHRLFEISAAIQG